MALVDLDSGHNHVGDARDRGPLWEITASADGRTVSFGPAHAKQFQWEFLGPEPKRLRLSWSGFALPAASQCRVVVTVALDDREPMSRWRITVEKMPEAGLRTIRFPRLFGLRRQPEERLAVPIWTGQELRNPRAVLCPDGGSARRFAWPYPGRLSLQCLAYYRNGANGFYAACDDTAARRKTLALWGTPGGDVHFEVVHYPEDQALGANRYRLPYTVRLGTFQGDWITAAERYRTWAVQQPWAVQSRLRRGRVPDWVLQTGLWIWNRGRSPGVLPPAARLQQRLRLPVSVLWHWWHGCAYDIGFPEYFPPREGTEPFRLAVQRAHDEGLHMLVYMNQRAWGMSTRSWREEGAERFAVKGIDGKVRPEVYNIFTRQALASMCLATPFWRNKYASLAERAFGELGVDGIYMDQACLQLPCYDPDHGHPWGGGVSWIEGFHSLVGDIRKRCGAQRPIALAGEGCGEPWLPYLDLMLALQVSRERYAAIGDPWEVIPLFQAVYHPYAITFGSYSSLVMPPYDELWPAEFAPKQPLALLDRKYANQFYLEQARAFVWGQQPTLANFRPELLRERPEEMDYVMRLARVRHRAAKYLLYGEFLRPPQLDAPQATSDFSRLSIYAGRTSRLTSYRRRHPLALAGAWRAADGDVAIALASIADAPLSISLKLGAEYGLLAKPARSVYRIDATGRHPFVFCSEGAANGVVKLDLPPRAAWVLEFPRRVP
ncbi:MAG: hypothetical protein GXP27_09220 [Planctomycetes bacterium]|nr:hypothetical protein [Planctomycetota bacterium]